MSEMAGYCVSM